VGVIEFSMKTERPAGLNDSNLRDVSRVLWSHARSQVGIKAGDYVYYVHGLYQCFQEK